MSDQQRLSRSEIMRAKNKEVILRMCRGDVKAAAKVMEHTKSPISPPRKPDSNALTVCITNHGRAEYLDRAIHSCADAGIEHVVVASMEPDDAVASVIKRWQRTRPNWIVWTSLAVDAGVNELWLQAVYRSRTEYVIVLHDDDYLSPDIVREYREKIVPAFERGAGFASWRGRVVNSDGTEEAAEYFEQPTGIYDSKQLEKVLLTDSRMSLSPIVSVLRRSVLIDALKEAQANLNGPNNYLHPTMLLGTEIIAYLRHCSAFEQWFFLGKVLSFYGAWSGSGTIKAQNEGQTDVVKHGYNLARRYFRANRAMPERINPRIIFVYSDYKAHDSDEKRRMDFAHSSWVPHFESGAMLDFPVLDGQLRRSSANLGDWRPVPYVRDLIEHGMSMAMPNDIVVLSNRDVILTTEAHTRILEGVQRGKGAAPAVRRNTRGQPPRAFLNSARCCHPDTGFDLFAFTPAWWRDNEHKVPDMLLGREAWDSVMRTLMNEAAGAETRMDDVFYHELHHSYWTGERVTNPGQLHNRALALQFFKRIGDEWMIQMLSVSNPEQLFQLESAKRASLSKTA